MIQAISLSQRVTCSKNIEQTPKDYFGKNKINPQNFKGTDLPYYQGIVRTIGAVGTLILGAAGLGGCYVTSMLLNDLSNSPETIENTCIGLLEGIGFIVSLVASGFCLSKLPNFFRGFSHGRTPLS